MKKVLIICDLFPPAFGPRMGYLCKYLQKSRWQPFVLTELGSDNTFATLAGYCGVKAMPYYPVKGGFGNSIRRLWLLALDLVFGYKEYLMYREAKKIVKAHDFSAILCSTYRDFPLATAVKISRKYSLPLLADFRDIVEQYSGYEFISRSMPALLTGMIGGRFRKKIISRRNRLLKDVHCVTTVSEWHVETLRQYNPNVHLIYNGYDPELFFPQEIKSDKFTIVYTGRLQSKAMRDPSLLFEALAKLRDEGIMKPENCRVQWYTDKNSWNIIEEEAARIGVSDFMDFCGYMPAQNIPAVLNGSSILLILAKETKSLPSKGIMTTKSFEYFAVEKPVLCVYSDGGLLGDLIRKTGAGLASSSVDEVCCFLSEYYAKWMAEGCTSVESDRRMIECFSRKEQALQFIFLLEKTYFP